MIELKHLTGEQRRAYFMRFHKWLADGADRAGDGDYAALRVAVAATGRVAPLPEFADHANQASAGWSAVALQTWGGRILSRRMVHAPFLAKTGAKRRADWIEGSRFARRILPSSV